MSIDTPLGKPGREENDSCAKTHNFLVQTKKTLKLKKITLFTSAGREVCASQVMSSKVVKTNKLQTEGCSKNKLEEQVSAVGEKLSGKFRAKALHFDDGQ